jgi:hypothetical protein
MRRDFQKCGAVFKRLMAPVFDPAAPRNSVRVGFKPTLTWEEAPQLLWTGPHDGIDTGLTAVCQLAEHIDTKLPEQESLRMCKALNALRRYIHRTGCRHYPDHFEGS